MSIGSTFLTSKIDDGAIAFSKSLYGKLIIFGLFCFCDLVVFLPLFMGEPYLIVYINLILALCIFFPKHRLRALALGNIGFLLIAPMWFLKLFPTGLYQFGEFVGASKTSYAIYALTLLYLVVAYGFIYLHQRFSHHPAFKHPIINSLAFLLVLVLIAEAKPFGGAYQTQIWFFIVTFCAHFWFLNFAIKDKKSLQNKSTMIGLFHPIWYFGRTPIAKGVSYLMKYDSKDEDSYALARVKGLKLGLESAVLMLIYMIMITVLYPALSLPNFDELMLHQAFANYSVLQCWLALILSFFEILFKNMALGGIAIATARMAGFHFLRNTYKPFHSKSIADFWNRYLFYFKELLADLFFYPAFLRFFKGNTKLRIAFATFMATFVGNMMYHVLRLLILVPQVGLVEFVSRLGTYTFYCLLLSAGIIASQLRNKKVNNPTLLQQSWNLTVIVGFFCFVHIFDDMEFERKLSDCFLFFFHLFGLV